MKWFLDSTTIRGALLNAVPAIYAVARLLGLDLPDGLLEDAVNGIVAFMAIVSIIMVWVGRFKKDVQPIGLTKA